jgi:CubicO group peptidase (beta-lactamase class C family)
MQSNIWTPLGMTSTTFDLESNQHIKSRLVDMAVRGPTGQLAHFPTALYPSPAKDDCGGIGSYSTAPDYMKILISLLRDDGRLLHTDSINEMFNPQLSDPTHLIQALNGEHKQMLAGSFPEVIKANHGLAGIINLERLQNRRMAGSMQWSGVPNLFWVRNSPTGAGQDCKPF